MAMADSVPIFYYGRGRRFFIFSTKCHYDIYVHACFNKQRDRRLAGIEDGCIVCNVAERRRRRAHIIMKRSGNHFPIEELLEAVLNSDTAYATRSTDLLNLAEEARACECSAVRTVVFGGGTGLSTVIGGNSQLADWPNNAAIGLKQLFPLLDVVVCTTDDGRSTGEFLKQLPMIGIGDLRKLCLSMILPDRLETHYGIDRSQRRALLRLIHRIFNHRFPEGSLHYRQMADPLLAAPESLRGACPKPLTQLLRMLGSFMTPGGQGPTVPPGGHCLGNILLTAAVFKEAGRCDRPPSMAALRAGIDLIARAIGSQPGRLHPATAVPGQLVFRYTNGVEVHGQSKSSTARRGFPVETVHAEFHTYPAVPAAVIRAVREADLIILAPGSLYTSSIPVLQLPGIAAAIRGNRSALKILAANFWVEEGETDMTRTDRRRGFRVSELVDAYDRNVPGGRAGLFDYVLSANLEHIPGSILRNYALEGKRPIYLDRRHVEAAGAHSVEATIFSVEHLKDAGVIQHDPKKFTLAVRTLLFANRHRRAGRKSGGVGRAPGDYARSDHRGKQLLCDYWSSFNRSLARKDFRPAHLRGSMLDLVWENRDMRLEHLNFFAGARIVPAAQWNRSIEWDNVLGYYDPIDRYVKLHRQLLDDPERLKGNMLIALGESLLGRYIERRRLITPAGPDSWGSRCFEIRLRPPGKRDCFLTPQQLHDYLVLARMVPHSDDAGTYRITLNHHDGFLPPGLLFGLMYAWYLENSYGPIMEIEMSILHLQEDMLIPHQEQEYQRKKALIDFFREQVFGYQRKIAQQAGAD